MASTTVSVKVPKELKEELERYGVDINEVIRRALEEELKRMKLQEAAKMIDEASKILLQIPEEEIIRSIREDRSAR
ncbi:hypothetical protein B6U66_03790 [Candidatus Bathyarchaeota archaeon ex4484_135]|nr:MAG: hypothetical protein B6U66_03790 [Candidatus Bathyarchaeota archaeon ex4484_135]